jgi:parallel beta-helix repeat protein
VHFPSTAAGEPPGRRGFYVRQTVGDDANDGLSPGTAWRSLSMLEDALQAGDTAYVGPGLYRETIVVGRSGTAEERITFLADTTGKHTGDPPGVVMITGADAVEETIFVPQAAPGVYMAPSPEGPVRGAVELDGPQYRYTAGRDTREHVREGMSELDVVAKLPSTFFYDSDAEVVYIHTSDGKPPASHEIELFRRNDGIVSFEKHFVTVIGFTFRHMAGAGINFEKGSSNCIAVNNTSYGAWQGIRVFNSTDVLVTGNTLFRNGNSGAYFLAASTSGYAIGNVLYENAKGVRWSSDCFENGDAGQLTAKIDHNELYAALVDYQRAANQDLGSREACGRLPEKIDVHRLHAETSAYAERARKILARDRTALQ